MSRRDTIDSMTAGETILLAAVNAAMSVPHSKSEHACIALCSVKRWVEQYICVPQTTNMVAAACYVGEKAEHFAGKTHDEYAQDVFIAAYQAAYEFSEALDHNLSMEAVTLPF